MHSLRLIWSRDARQREVRTLIFFWVVQRAVLEPAMQGSDMIGRARTGTGKTLAFGIPIMDKIIRFNEKHGFVQSAFSLGLSVIKI